MSQQNATDLVGKVVRDDRGSIGKVTGAYGGEITVAWVDTCVESMLSPGSVTVVDNPSEYQKAWTGGFGVLDRFGSDVIASHELER